ncbi:hypothetical protein TanjilG_18766 [Lupinus angustifolius]|uniref:Uncharacterized protein n=1 Tax=Lupinus angustifolius TaxID=3871 RepID=A0A1J7H5M3_LUPAN|nr:hypothetical protein TanjilG_19583 [Lupinus angustifolius]OIV98482.1 hypothetical protein TanjilG_18766 [Lupinus angustifolius]
MNHRKTCTLLNLVVVVTFVAILISHRLSGVDARRVLLDSQDFAHANHLSTYTSSVYEQSKNTMAIWLQRLASGPSHKGLGH